MEPSNKKDNDYTASPGGGGGGKLYNDKSEPERFFLQNQPNKNMKFFQVSATYIEKISCLARNK